MTNLSHKRDRAIKLSVSIAIYSQMKFFHFVAGNSEDGALFTIDTRYYIDVTQTYAMAMRLSLCFPIRWERTLFVMTWRHFPHYRSFVKGINQPQIDFSHKRLFFVFVFVFLLVWQAVETVMMPVIWHAVTLMRRHSNECPRCRWDKGEWFFMLQP